MVTPEQIERYRRDGFLVVEGLLTDDELARYGAAVDAGVARRMAHDARGLAEKTPYEQSFQQCMNPWADCPDVRPLIFHPRIGEVAAADRQSDPIVLGIRPRGGADLLVLGSTTRDVLRKASCAALTLCEQRPGRP